MGYDCRCYCTPRAQKNAKKSKHRILSECTTIQHILALNPEYGVRIANAPALRKMRVAVPSCQMGKRGGYRLIYRNILVDEIMYLILLDVYAKNDCEDLTTKEYKALYAESENILQNLSNVAWEMVRNPSL